HADAHVAAADARAAAAVARAAAVDEAAAALAARRVGRRPALREHFLARSARALPLGQHALDRRDAAERLLREAPGVSDRADQLAVDVDRAAAHAGADAAVLDAGIPGAHQAHAPRRQEV